MYFLLYCSNNGNLHTVRTHFAHVLVDYNICGFYLLAGHNQCLSETSSNKVLVNIQCRITVQHRILF